MRLIGLAVILAVSLVLAPLAVKAQQVGTRRIGLLESISSSPARVQLWETLRQRLRELGYLEGQNIAFESRFAEGENRTASGSCGRAGCAKGRRYRHVWHVSEPGGKA